MEINLIRERISDNIYSSETHDIWVNILQETSPANYGVENIHIDLRIKDIWVELPKRTFTYKNAELSFSARLGGSSLKNGYDANFRKTVSGRGRFEFVRNTDEIKITETEIKESLDLY